VILSPYIPMLFMGEEYGEPAPFLYHVSHSDPELLEAVRRGRMRELAEFAEASEMPDPKDEETFRRSKLNQHLAESGQHARLHAWYQCLIEFRRTHPALQISDQRNTVAIPLAGESALLVRRIANSSQVLILLHFGTVTRALKAYLPKGDWRKVLDSSDTEWGGPGSSIPVALSSTGDLVSLDMAPRTCVVFLNESA
jgi:maltooligosyltrehalose trehalohydrolase